MASKPEFELTGHIGARQVLSPLSNACLVVVKMKTRKRRPLKIASKKTFSE